jgi:hypothetical protein
MMEMITHIAQTISKSKSTGNLVKIYGWFKSYAVSKEFACQHKESSSTIQLKQLHQFLPAPSFFVKFDTPRTLLLRQ